MGPISIRGRERLIEHSGRLAIETPASLVGDQGEFEAWGDSHELAVAESLVALLIAPKAEMASMRAFDRMMADLPKPTGHLSQRAGQTACPVRRHAITPLDVSMGELTRTIWVHHDRTMES